MMDMAQLTALSELLSLKGRRALITGAASGIGKAIASRFAEAGAALELVDVDADRLAAAQTEFKGCDGGARAHVVNLSSKDAIAALWDGLADNVPDILVNIAGIYPMKRFLDVTEKFFHRVMDTNLSSVYWMCQEMIGRRRKQGGIIINTGSIEGVMPFKHDLAHYSVSKAGVVALTRALAKEHARDGFRINALLPGGINTEGTRAVARQIFRFNFGLFKTGADFAARLPAGRLGRPDEIALMALMLATDIASYVHGAAIPVDGGFLAA